MKTQPYRDIDIFGGTSPERTDKQTIDDLLDRIHVSARNKSKDIFYAYWKGFMLGLAWGGLITYLITQWI